jgi:hypothetical protein
LVTALLIGAASANLARAEDATPSPFDGKSLAGWTTLDGKPVTVGWEAVDGVIHLRKDGQRAGHIVTAQEFGDFQLSFEWKIAPKGNSGIKYRVRNYGNKTLGCEYQVYDDTKGRVQPKNSAGALYDLYEPNSEKELKPAGEYNTAKIIVHGDKIEHWLNGKRIVSATVGDEEWQRRVAASKFNDVPDFSRNARGKLMLTDHGSEVWYRNFVFEPLGEPVAPREFKHARILDAWQNYSGVLTFGRGQTLALVDDGCRLGMPEWQAKVDGLPKVLVTYDSVDGDDDPKHEGKGYHGSSIGIPSSLNYNGKRGVAYNNQVAVIRALECCHCNVSDSRTLAAGLQWIIDNHRKYRITTVNLAPVDDQAHDKPVPTEIDDKLATLREQGIWVSAPTGNHNYTTGVSWPACQPNCFAIGAVQLLQDVIYLDRHEKVDLLVPAQATSSSNAIACGAAMLLREAIEKSGYKWQADGKNQPEAMLAIMQRTGKPVDDPATKRTFRRLDVQAALEHVFAQAKTSSVQ